MAMYEVKTEGRKRRKSRKGGKLRAAGRTAGRVALAPFRLAKAIIMRPRMVMAAGLVGGVLYVGTPHVGWDYQCNHPTRGGQPCMSVSYCAYYGFQGRRVVFPDYGEPCRLIGFVPVDWEKLGTDIRELVMSYVREL